MTKPSHGSSGRVLYAGALILLLLLFAFIAGKEALSNLYAQSADLEVERWSKPGQKLKGDEETRVLHYLDESLRYAPNNAWALERRATLRLRQMADAIDPEFAVGAARGANADFGLALRARPTSPYLWAKFALSKLFLDEKDEVMFRALDRAEELGPWVPGAQQAATFAGLAVWDRLNPGRRAGVVGAMERGAQKNQGKIFEIAKSFNRVDLFCGLRYSDPQERERCGPAGTTGKSTRANTVH